MDLCAVVPESQWARWEALRSAGHAYTLDEEICGILDFFKNRKGLAIENLVLICNFEREIKYGNSLPAKGSLESKDFLDNEKDLVEYLWQLKPKQGNFLTNYTLLARK